MQFITEKLPQLQAVSTTPCDAALRIDALEVADKDHAEVHTRRNARTTTFFVKRLAQLLSKVVELPITEHTIQSVVKHMPDRGRQLRRRHPQFRLPLRTTLTKSHLLLSIPEIQDQLQDSANSNPVQVKQRPFSTGS